MDRSVLSRGLRVALFGDGAWAADTLDLLQGGPHTVSLVVLRRRPSDDRLEARGRALRIPLLQPDKVNDGSVSAALRDAGVDVGLSIAYDQIFHDSVLTTPPLGLLNVHAGMLPAYRGRNVINWALINGEREIGVTVHFVDGGVDTGDLLLQQALPIGWCDTYGDVLYRVVHAVPPMVREALDQLASGNYERRPQIGPGTYFAGRSEGDEWLDWSDPSEVLHNKIRGITRPGPGARTLLGDRVIRIWRAYFDPSWPRYRATPGQVVGRSTEGAIVKTGDSTLLVKEVQEEDGAPGIPHWAVGTRLGLNLAVVAAEVMRGRRIESRGTDDRG